MPTTGPMHETDFNLRPTVLATDTHAALTEHQCVSRRLRGAELTAPQEHSSTLLPPARAPASFFAATQEPMPLRPPPDQLARTKLTAFRRRGWRAPRCPSVGDSTASVRS